jgi:hypothetical protein
MAVAVRDIKSKVDSYITKLNDLDLSLQSSFTTYKVNSLHSSESSATKNTSLRERDVFDQEFWDTKQKYGDQGIPRQETLQEFILWFFFLSLILFGISIVVYQYIITQSGSQAFKAFGAYFFILFILLALFLRYA